MKIQCFILFRATVLIQADFSINDNIVFSVDATKRMFDFWEDNLTGSKLVKNRNREMRYDHNRS